MTPIAVTTYSDFYNKSYPADWKNTLRLYPTDAVIMTLVKINATLFLENGGGEQIQNKLLNQVFPLLDLSRVIRVQSLKKHDRFTNTTPPVWFNEQAILKLLALTCQTYVSIPENDNGDYPQFQNDLFDCILISNELYYKEITPYKLFSYEHVWQLSLMQQEYIRSFAARYESVLLKYMFLLKFLKELLPFGEVYLNEFCEALGLANYYSYAVFFMDIFKNLFDNYNEFGEIKWNLGADHSNSKLLDEFSLRPVDLEQGKLMGLAHKELTAKPFYFLMNKVPVIIDFNFFWHLMDTSLMYIIYNFSPSCKSKHLKFDDWRSTLAKQFYEEYLVAGLLKNIYDHRHEKVLCDKEVNSITDIVVIQNKKDIFLVEVKAASVNVKVFDNVDVLSFKSHLEKNFSADKKQDGKNKGVNQLAAALDKLESTLKDSEINIESPEKCTVYPIIVYTDLSLDTTGVNSWCNDRFIDILSTSSKKLMKVAPLTMININFLITHFMHLKKDHSALKNLIIQYHRRIASNKQSTKKNPNPMVYFNANISFTNFIKTLNIIKFKNMDNMRFVVESFSLTK